MAMMDERPPKIRPPGLRIRSFNEDERESSKKPSLNDSPLPFRPGTPLRDPYPNDVYVSSPEPSTPKDKSDRDDSISSGNFGKLVRIINGETASIERPLKPDPKGKISLNLYKVTPDSSETGEDQCTRWQKHRFKSDSAEHP
jgi:hypothetical protein